MSGWDRRKRAELTAKLASLQEDLRGWSARSQAGQPLEKHHSQLLRLQQDFVPVAERLSADWLEAAPEPADISPERWPDVERAVADLLSVWGYFRDKLAVRLVPGYAGHLCAADDFAWACSLPAQRAAVAAGTVAPADVREPPLTCLDDVASPYSLVRGASYEGELAGAQRLSASSRRLLRRLPIPVIAVPWFQLEHLPDVLVVAHEVGHHLLRDLRLEEAAADAVRAAGQPAVPAAWATEMFCDVVGTLSAGRAFAAALGDFLRVAEVTEDGGEVYPPTSVRLSLCLSVLELERVGSAAHAAELAGRWAADGLVLPAQDRAAAGPVAAALATTMYPSLGRRLVDLEPFTAQKEESADQQATELKRRRTTTTRDVRVLLAAAALAFGDEPEEYRERDTGAHVLEMARRIREPGVRWRVTRPGGGDSDGSGPAGVADDLYRFLMEPQPA